MLSIEERLFLQAGLLRYRLLERMTEIVRSGKSGGEREYMAYFHATLRHTRRLFSAKRFIMFRKIMEMSNCEFEKWARTAKESDNDFTKEQNFSISYRIARLQGKRFEAVG